MAHRVVACLLPFRASARVLTLANGPSAALSLAYPGHGRRPGPPPLARQGITPYAGLSCLTDQSTHRGLHAAPGFCLYSAITDPCRPIPLLTTPSADLFEFPTVSVTTTARMKRYIGAQRRSCSSPRAWKA